MNKALDMKLHVVMDELMQCSSPTTRDLCGIDGADSPRSNASTRIPSGTGSYELGGQSWSLDSLRDTSTDWLIPEPTSFVPAGDLLRRRNHLQQPALGKPAGQKLLTTSLGPVGWRANNKVLSHRNCDSGVSIPRGPGHENSKETMRAQSSPGPTSYRPNDKLQAHHRKFPSATFGRGTGHDLQDRTPSPGPAAFNVDDRNDARHRRASRATIGRGPGHGIACNPLAKSPGPADYRSDDTVLAGHRKFPTCTIGRAQGHASLLVPDSAPAPGSYDLTRESLGSGKKRGVSIHCAERYCATAEERHGFRRVDQNTDGKLDFQEMESLLRGRFPEIQAEDVIDILRSADSNHDGELDFQEVISYTHATNPMQRRLREQMRMAFAAPGQLQSFCEGEEREQFRRADTDLDGQWDMAEVELLMRRHNSDIKRRDVRNIFQELDRNHDGKISFHEFTEYTRAKHCTSRRLREKLRAAAAAPQENSRCASHAALKSNVASTCTASPSSNHSTPSMRRSASASAVGSLIGSSR